MPDIIGRWPRPMQTMPLGNCTPSMAQSWHFRPPARAAGRGRRRRERRLATEAAAHRRVAASRSVSDRFTPMQMRRAASMASGRTGRMFSFGPGNPGNSERWLGVRRLPSVTLSRAADRLGYVRRVPFHPPRRSLMSSFKCRAYPLLITAITVLAATGGALAHHLIASRVRRRSRGGRYGFRVSDAVHTRAHRRAAVAAALGLLAGGVPVLVLASHRRTVLADPLTLVLAAVRDRQRARRLRTGRARSRSPRRSCASCSPSPSSARSARSRSRSRPRS